jgi:flagellin
MVSVIYNQAAAIANRTLQNTSNMATGSLEKLSSGKRVVHAKDDASSMAIGSRMQLASKALKALSRNVTQGLSVTSIAEGGLPGCRKCWVECKNWPPKPPQTIWGQAERGFLNSEFQAIKLEITRTTASTRFNGNALINGNQNNTLGADLVASRGFQDLAFGNIQGIANSPQATLTYQSAAGGTGAGTFGLNFNTNGGGSMSGILDSTILRAVSTRLATGTSVRLSYGSTSNKLNDADAFVIVNLNTNFSLNAAVAGNTINFGTQSNQTNLAFKVGDGGQSYNAINSYIQGVNLAALGLSQCRYHHQTGVGWGIGCNQSVHLSRW